MTTKELNIKNRTYYFYNDLINVLNFEASNLKLDKKSCKDLDIYYIGYVDKNKSSNWNVNSANPLHLIVTDIYGTITEKNGHKFLSIDSYLGDHYFNPVLKKYNQVFSGLKHHNKEIEFGHGSEKVVYDSDFDKIKFLTDDNLHLKKLIYFPNLTVVIRCVFKQNGIFTLKFI